MLGMVLEQAGRPLRQAERPDPEPGLGELLIRVQACGVCRTDLHIYDGELTEAKLPLILGHQIVGIVSRLGSGCERFRIGDRVGVPWLGKTCGLCAYCKNGKENLCEQARFTGYHLDGGFAELTIAAEQFSFAIPESFSDLQAAPLLCGGLIGYRSLRMCGEPLEAHRLGLYGFGSAAHIILQVAVFQGREVYAFTRKADAEGQSFALKLGAVWAGDSTQLPPRELDAAIIFAPVGALVPQALQAVRKGGTVVCGGIHMSDIPSFPYKYLWGERSVRSVANLTRRDGGEFLRLAAEIPIRTEVSAFPLTEANAALQALREGRTQGSIVLTVG